MNESWKNYFGKTDQYDDIIHLPHHVSDHRPHMPESDRAAQFAPFAALTGYGAAIKETARVTEKKIELDEEEKELLDRKLEELAVHLPEQPEAVITYFQPDARKEGGSYQKFSGRIRKIDFFRRVLVMTDRTEIKVDDIIAIQK